MPQSPLVPVGIIFLVLIIILFSGITAGVYAQSVKLPDSVGNTKKLYSNIWVDSSQNIFDSSVNKLKFLSHQIKDDQILLGRQRAANSFASLKKLKSDSVARSLLSAYSLKGVFNSKPLIRFGGGYIAYNMNYRSNIDTPIVERDIHQHSVNGSMNIAVANIPLRVNYLLRRSNSMYFRDINDIQVEFDAAGYRNMLQNNLRQRLLSMVPKLKDSLLEIDYKNKLKSFNLLHDQVNDPMQLQKLIEYKEILNLPDDLNDSVENAHVKNLKKEARDFIIGYNAQKKQLEKLSSTKDSAEQLYQRMQSNIASFKDLIQNKLNKFKNTDQLKAALTKCGVKGVEVPARYQQLMNIKRIGLGRNQLNYSELTSKNISLTGVNIEYNSWYYVAVAAGTVDYRFRDFVVNKLNRSPQYIYMARLGVGRLEHNYFIVTAYKGQKQLFASGVSGTGIRSINIKGFAAEAKMQLAPATYIIAEAAESLSPDFRKAPAETQKFDLKDESNKAFSLRFASYLPKTNSRIEAMYKYTGANFQSFSSFQTNSTNKAWSVKADQQFLKRKLRISASIRSNDFSNPYIIQNYKSNTIFKSLQASFRSKHFPTITIGYVPMSQLTYIDSVLLENHFQSLNAGLTHFYKIGERKATSSFVYNRFYNTSADSSFAYYNAENIFFCQRIEFLLYTMNVSISHSKSPGFELNVLDGGINVKAGKLGAIGFGVKVNDFDKVINTRGVYGSIQINLKKMGVLSAGYDNGYLPANNHRFIKSNQMNVNFIKQLK